MARGSTKVSKIRGVVIPTAWDDQGNVTGIAISSHDENEYQVDPRGKGPELLLHIHKEVEAAGVVRDEEGKKIVRIRKYTVSETIESTAIYPTDKGGEPL
ncbi:MAG: hypothetical protein ACM34H_06580 [Deltaproteobacteria bacterium]